MIEVMRAEHEWQRAGAYSVRIQGMNKQHKISLREEFDEHDCDGTKYIILLDDGYPVATCRFYEINNETVTLGRVVVLPEYRRKKIGSMVMSEAEKWIAELGYSIIEIESRTVATEFYKKNGFRIVDNNVIKSGFFECVRMIKYLE